MLEPVVATVVAWAWLEQALSPAQVLGGVVILAGVGIALRVGSAGSTVRADPHPAAVVPGR